MSNKASSLKSQIEEFSRRQGIAGEMDQNLVKEAIHLHLLSAMSDAGILRHAVFQGGTALRLCYGGDRYSEDLDFVCGKAGSYFTDVEFKELIEAALETTKKTLNRDFGIAPDRISLKKPPHPDLVKQEPITVAAWQIIVPIEATPRAPKSLIKIEFANVPAYETKPMPVRATPGLVQVQDVILTVETPNEILADKAVALTAREVLKFRDVWDVWFLQNKLDAKVDREVVQKKFADYGTSDMEAKAEKRLAELSSEATPNAFLSEMKRFLPAKRVAQLSETGLQHSILTESGDLLRRAVLPVSSYEFR
ncbi:nucleotidyl transferase AbiEii/AbiGii toxin family protein [Bradyrhizobium sp. Ash2021]|uniref:nucleotidyl transferase AbiEii/AbiGii toxin family protein n=1 Tax=Bradyrhizobium sp. Ash2021 TaxID=2954771 RepID=UPI0028154283|nr:nucleotidyl transferase AbiEii/AbiGii toxin family protein [Bradyrhizobium sp. Ash2021]WMT73495.1 nucleotidyl transferase AbiEii/AbiGii toxin family protein [Bradyrhizobium sp. Ash2021]